MGATQQHSTSLQDARGELLEFALNPENWVTFGRLASPPSYQRQVGNVVVRVAVNVTPTLDTWLCVSFRGPELSPMLAADHLETLCSGRFTFTPNTEWQVEIDTRKWIHFSRKYTGPNLGA